MAKESTAKLDRELDRVLVKSRQGGKQTRGGGWLPTGADLLDLVVGAGRGLGFESGLLVNFPGQSSGGKTFICCEVIACAHRFWGDKLEWVYDDCESGFTFDTKKLYGFEIMPPKIKDRTRSATVEEAFGNITQRLNKLEKGKMLIYVLDSLDGLLSKKAVERVNARQKAHEKGKEYTEETYGMEKAKFLSTEMLPTLNRMIEEKNALVIITSQLRDNVGGGLYGPKDRVSIGRALYFYSHIQMWTQMVEEIMSHGRQIGNRIKVWTKKAKGPRPYRQCFLPLFFDYGIDNIGANVDYYYELLTAGGDFITAVKNEYKKASGDEEDGDEEEEDDAPTLRKKRASKKKLEYVWDGEVIAQTREEAIRYFDHDQRSRLLSVAVLEKWEEAEQKALAPLEGRRRKYGPAVESDEDDAPEEIASQVANVNEEEAAEGLDGGEEDEV